MFSRFFLLLLSVAAVAQEAPVDPLISGTEQKKTLFSQVGENLFLMGEVRIDSKAREVRFPAKVNMTEGQIEYVLVTNIGKLHESLLSTEIEPYHLQTALLLLGLKGAGLPDPSQPQSGPAKAEALGKIPEIGGEPINIEVNWTDSHGEKKAVPLETWILKSPKNSVMTKGPWTYSGSRSYEGAFLAQEFGSIISAISDLDAMVNNPRPGHGDDKIWSPNTKAMPKAGTPVEILLKVDNRKADPK